MGPRCAPDPLESVPSPAKAPGFAQKVLRPFIFRSFAPIGQRPRELLPGPGRTHKKRARNRADISPAAHSKALLSGQICFRFQQPKVEGPPMNEMQTPTTDTPPTRSDWMQRLDQIGNMHGFFDRIGADHLALYVQEGDTLLVSFDEVGRVMTRGQNALPVGFNAVSKREWSFLSLMAEGDTWFRDDALYTFFDRLIDDGFFDSFERVVFLGAGPMCGYAAAAYSVAAPGATLFALSPAATLNREQAPYELRFRRSWARDFSHRYAFAPAMAEAASQAFIVYDPGELLDAAHAAQFRGPKISRLRFRGAGRDLLGLLEPADTLDRCLKAAVNGKMSPYRFARITRQLRQTHPAYLKRLLMRAEERGGTRLPLIVARHGLAETGDAHFARAMMTLEAQAREEA